MTLTGNRRPLNEQVREEAADWLVAFCEDEVDAAGREEFNAWLRTSPEHVRAYLRVSALWEDEDLFHRSRRLDAESLVQRAIEAGNVVSLSDAESPATPEAARNTEHGGREPARIRRLVAIAASVLVLTVAVGLLIWFQRAGTSIYETAVGESRTVTLVDGSTLALNARSRVAVRYDRSLRSVELIEGQALFRVAKNPLRPFVVRSGSTSIRAVGTEFDVYRGSEKTVVTVLEGRVAVSALSGGSAQPRATESAQPARTTPSAAAPIDGVMVSAGEQLVATRDVLTAPKPANVQNATAWREGKIVVESTPLREVIDEFNRHSPRRLVIEDPALAEVRISGIFAFADSAQFVQFLSQRFSLAVDEEDDEIRLVRN